MGLLASIFAHQSDTPNLEPKDPFQGRAKSLLCSKHCSGLPFQTTNPCHDLQSHRRCTASPGSIHVTLSRLGPAPSYPSTLQQTFGSLLPCPHTLPETSSSLALLRQLLCPITSLITFVLSLRPPRHLVHHCSPASCHTFLHCPPLRFSFPLSSHCF